MDDKQLKEVTERLDMIIKIMSIGFTEEETSPIEQIKKLLAVGMTPSQIGRLLGKPTNNITAYMARIKKKSNKQTNGRQ